jgi:hypothetical protein
MSKVLLTLAAIFLITISGVTQVRVGTLVVKPNQTYQIGESDIIVADTLIMMDSSTIRLNRLKRENFIRAEVAYLGSGCKIVGSGVDGGAGNNGRNGETPVGPCRDGGNARNGGRGLDGGNGNDLYLYFGQLILTGKVEVDLSGGSGGKGGDGGDGGGGSPGTLHCVGGDGGDAGNGGNGANGGNGGKLTISCLRCSDVRALVSRQVSFKDSGGHFGFGGKSGYAGAPGLAPKRKYGKTGTRGKDGLNGRPGEKGSLNFEIN